MRCRPHTPCGWTRGPPDRRRHTRPRGSGTTPRCPCAHVIGAHTAIDPDDAALHVERPRHGSSASGAAPVFCVHAVPSTTTCRSGVSRPCNRPNSAVRCRVASYTRTASSRAGGPLVDNRAQRVPFQDHRSPNVAAPAAAEHQHDAPRHIVHHGVATAADGMATGWSSGPLVSPPHAACRTSDADGSSGASRTVASGLVVEVSGVATSRCTARSTGAHGRWDEGRVTGPVRGHGRDHRFARTGRPPGASRQSGSTSRIRPRRSGVPRKHAPHA